MSPMAFSLDRLQLSWEGHSRPDDLLVHYLWPTLSVNLFGAGTDNENNNGELQDEAAGAILKNSMSGETPLLMLEHRAVLYI